MGGPRKGSPFKYVGPGYERDPHQSLAGAWVPLEWLPKSDRYKEWPGRQSLWGTGIYLPMAEPRPVEDNAWVHESVLRRKADVKHYDPINLPPTPRIVPIPNGPLGY